MNQLLMNCRQGIRCHSLRAGALLWLVGLGPAWGALTDLASAPITNSSAAQAKPNIMLLMDTSDSMGWTHMPDEVETIMGTQSIGYKSAQCNALYYNPNTVYGLPRQADGTFFPTPSFTSARYDAFNSASTATVNLSTSFVAFDSGTLRISGTSDTPQPAYYYTYTGSQTLSYSAAPCTDTDVSATTAASGGGTWTRVVVGASERQNFANWYAYYRTRMALTKSALSQAFTPLNDSFRVGFLTVMAKNSPSDTSIEPSKYLPISDFNTTQRTLWFSKLFSQTPSGTSPAREALARVGRHYAGRTDGINAGMNEDPLQYSCQQNFTILTTDGYWNDQQETPDRGPVQIDGTTRVGQQDATLTDSSGLTPRPIWEGFSDGLDTERNKTVSYSYANCSNAYFQVQTVQNMRSTAQATAATSQLTRSLVQNLVSTTQNLSSTVQNLRSTSQATATTSTATQTVTVALQSTSQTTRTRTNIRRSTTQRLQSTSQPLRSTSQALQSTVQTLSSTSQVRRSTLQRLLCDASRGETCTPVATCTASGLISCEATATGPTLVSSCTPESPTSSNNFVEVTCAATSLSSNTPVASCTPASASSANSFTTTTCSSSSTSNVPVASCTAAGPSAANNFTTITCPAPITTGPTPVASCTAQAPSSSNSFTATTCPAPITSTPVAVASCTTVAPTSTNGFVGTVCTNNNNSNVRVASCTPESASSANNFVTTTCSNSTDGPTFVPSCTASDPTAGNSFTTTTCNTNVTTNVPVASCTPSSPSSGNRFVSTTCPSPTVISGPVSVASCTPTEPTSSNGFQRTSCTGTSVTAGVTSCTPQTPNASNGYTTITCNVATQDNIPVASCTPSGPSAGNNYTTTTCPAPIVTTSVPVASCTASAASSGNSWVATTCPTPVSTGPTPAASCTPAQASASNNWVTTSCNTQTSGPVGVESCTPQAASADNNWTQIACQTQLTPATGVAACVAQEPTAQNGYTQTTCTNNVTPAAAVAACTPASATAGNQWTTTLCTTNTTGPVVAATCTPEGPSAANDYTTTLCTALTGQKIQATTTSTVTTTPVSGGRPSGAAVASSTTSTNDLDGVCYGSGQREELPPLPASHAAPGDSTCAAWPCTTRTANTGGSINSLADVAQYYYATDLRSSMTNDVPAVGSGPEDDRAPWQHMTTFTIALGVSGTLNYRPDYRLGSTTTGDFAEIRTPNAQGDSRPWPVWPDPSLSGWSASGLTYTNKAIWNNPRSIDDFWHAAVNGRGQFFSARNPDDVVSGINGALTGITSRLGGATAGVSSLSPVEGNNFVYTANYTSVEWTGDVEARQINLTTGLVGTEVLWSVRGPLDTRAAAACDNRSIFLMRAGATHNLTNFTYNTSVCDVTGAPTGVADTGLNTTEQAYFNADDVAQLSQFPTMTDGTNGTADQRSAAAGANLVNFLRGHRGLEGFTAGDVGKLYRSRAHILGDIIHGQPVLVKAPFARYQDSGYLDFKTNQAARQPMLYVPANDGMLHAFYAQTSTTDSSVVAGKEAWAVVPSSMLPNLYKLADANYANLHQYLVDGVPTVADVLDSASTGGGWKTILMGGLNGGGRAYYALDVTNPSSPKGLWEFKWTPGACYDPATPSTATTGGDCHLGFSYGKPIITKLSNGTWVALVTSGHNNVNSPTVSGDGQGYLYVLNAMTGHIIHKIGTGQGSATNPAGLVHINNFVDNAAINNTTLRVYGGDLLGHIWRFDINDTIAPAGREARLLGITADSSGNAQPITTRPELAELNYSPMVYVATGRLLGVSDLSSTQTQSVYAFVDPLTSTQPAYSDLRAALKPRVMTAVGSIATGDAGRTVACPATASESECTASAGWVVDLPGLGERVNVDMRLLEGNLVIGSNIPTGTACDPSGESWLTYLNFGTGLAVAETTTTSDSSDATATLVSRYVSGSLITGVSVVKLPSGKNKTVLSTGRGGAGNIVDSSPVGVGGAKGGGGTVVFDAAGLPIVSPGKRVSWREIVQ